MSEMDFHIEFNIELSGIQPDLLDEVADRLKKLSAGHTDLIGAAVGLEKIADGDTPYLYRGRIVVHIRPENIAAVSEEKSPDLALRSSLEAIEDQVRAKRTRSNQPWQQPEQIKSDSMYELSKEEIFATYIGRRKPEDLLKKSRGEIAADLMVNHNLSQDAAYYAASVMLEHAQEMVNNQQNGN